MKPFLLGYLSIVCLLCDSEAGAQWSSMNGPNGGESFVPGYEKYTAFHFALEQNYPNPFNPTTDIGFRNAEFGFVKLAVYDLLGHEVRVLVNGRVETGVHRVTFSANGGDGSSLPSGVYFYRLAAGAYVETKKLLLIR